MNAAIITKNYDTKEEYTPEQSQTKKHVYKQDKQEISLKKILDAFQLWNLLLYMYYCLLHRVIRLVKV